jgi:PAS domain S-box-containing protein
MTDVIGAPAGLRPFVAKLERARGNERRVRAIFDNSPYPMVVLDGRRRYLDANGPARLMFRMGIDELRERVVDDLTAARQAESIDESWERFLAVGHVTGTYETQTPDGTLLEVSYYAVANVMPGLHMGVFAPAHWAPDELGRNDHASSERAAALTPREREVLSLAVGGLSGPQIARELAVSPETVKNHFAHIRAKLGVRNRTAAVAQAIHLGLID